MGNSAGASQSAALFPALRQSLRAWADAAWDMLKSRLPEARRNDLRPMREGGDVIGSWSSAPEVLWPEKYTSEVLASPQWQNVLAAIHQNETLRRHVNDGVGTALGSSHFSPNSIAFAFWPSALLVAHWKAELDSATVRDAAFSKVYDAVEQFFASDAVHYIVTTPIAGLLCERVPLELEAGVVIDVMTDEEIAEATARRLLRSSYGRTFTRDDLPPYFRICLRRTMTTTKFVGDYDFDTAEGDRLRALPFVDRTRVARALSVVLDNRFVPQSYIARQAGWNPAGGELAMPTVVHPYAGWGNEKALLTRHDEADVAHAWRLFGDTAFEDMGTLRIPVDRLANLNARASAEDALLDLSIAVEVFFRAGEESGKRKGGLVRQRMMDYIDARDISLSKALVGEWSDRAYRMRNALVHEGRIDVNDLPPSPDPDEGRMTLSQFIEDYERLVRRAVGRFVRESPSPRSPTWGEDPDLGAS